MKKAVVLCFCLIINYTFSQTSISEYFVDKETNCKFKDIKDKQLFFVGLRALEYEDLREKTPQFFMNLIAKDSSQCDSWFFAGYALRLQKRFPEAVIMYYMADSLSAKKSILFKQNLAYAAAAAGGYELARTKYNEIIEYFPDNPEGYYGIAATSIFVGDYENGLTNVNLAILKYEGEDAKIGKEVYFLKAQLLTLTSKYKESLSYYEKVRGDLTKSDHFKVHYAYSMKMVGDATNDERLGKKAQKLYDKIEDKTVLTEDYIKTFNK